MTWKDFSNRMGFDLSDDDINLILWCKTAYPIADVKLTVKQFCTAARALRSNIELCECCGRNIKYHEKDCLCKEVFG